MLALIAILNADSTNGAALTEAQDRSHSERMCASIQTWMPFMLSDAAADLVSEISVGTHRMHQDKDVVLIRWYGTPLYEDLQVIQERFDQVIAEYGYLFIVGDMRHSGLPSAQTRKLISDWSMRNPSVIVVNFGASLIIRTLQGLMLRAMALIGKKSAIELVQCESEAEALAWVDARRLQFP